MSAVEMQLASSQNMKSDYSWSKWKELGKPLAMSAGSAKSGSNGISKQAINLFSESSEEEKVY